MGMFIACVCRELSSVQAVPSSSHHRRMALHLSSEPRLQAPFDSLVAPGCGDPHEATYVIGRECYLARAQE